MSRFCCFEDAGIVGIFRHRLFLLHVRARRRAIDDMRNHGVPGSIPRVPYVGHGL